MSTLASLRILLGLDSGDVTKGAGRVRGDLKGVQAEANKTRDAFAGIKSGLAAGFGLGAGIGAFNLGAKAAQEFTQFVGDSITKASALNETLSKSAVIFGQDAAAVEAWGRTAATAFGQSTGQAIEARATLGNLFKTMGLGRADVLGMSGSIVELASDLASFNNIGTDEALEKLRSGLVGQAEPLRTLGVQLTEANVEAKAMALGLAGANGALSESAKVQARYALILEQTGTAQGDFGRTSEGLANQQKELAANIDNLSAEFGALVVGPLTSLVKILNTAVIPGIRGVAEIADTLSPVLAGLATVLGVRLAASALAAATNMGIAAAAALGFGTATTAAAAESTVAATLIEGNAARAKVAWLSILGPLGLIAGAAVGGKVALDELNTVVRKTNDDQIAAAIAAGDLSHRIEELTADAKAGKITWDEYDIAVSHVLRQQELQAAATQGLASETTALEQEARNLARTHAAAAAAAAALTVGTVGLTTATQAGAAAMLAAREATLDAATAAAELAKWEAIAGDSSAELNNDLLTAANGMDGFTASTNTATTALGHFLTAAGKVPSQTGVDEPRQNFIDDTGDPHLNPTARNAKTAADKAASDARSAREKAAREAERAGAEKAAEAARRHADMLADQFDAAKDKARDYFDVLHAGNQRAIDDIRDRANEELTAQQKAIRGVVSAEQARINAVRAREQENSLRGAVTAAETPEDRTSAQRDLNRFLEDQRLGRMNANADIAVALIDQEKAKNDALAAEATKAENTRAADQRAAFDDEIAALQKNLSRHPELWGKAQEAIKKLLRDSVPDFAAIGQAQIDAFEAPLKKLGLVPPSVTATSPNATATGLSSAGDHSHVIHNHLYLNGQEVMDWIERGLANNKAVYNPAPPSASGRV